MMACTLLFLFFVDMMLLCSSLQYSVNRASLVAQSVKSLPAMQETQVQSPGWEDPLEKKPTPVFLPGEFHEQRSLVGYSPWWVTKSRT